MVEVNPHNVNLVCGVVSCMRQGANDTSSSQGDDVQFIKEEDTQQQRGTKRARSPDKEEKKRSVK